jgi:hypothetical protein
MHRIEDDIYPEKTMSTMHTPDILHQACPPNCALLKTWLHSKAFIDQEFLRPDNDPETRSFIIVTGNCSGVSDTHHNGGVWVDANRMRIDCHFDDFDSLVFLTTDEKTFLLFRLMTSTVTCRQMISQFSHPRYVFCSYTHTHRHIPSSDTYPSQVITDNEPSFFCSRWFRVANDKTPQITRYEHFQSQPPRKPEFDFTGPSSSPPSPAESDMPSVSSRLQPS